MLNGEFNHSIDTKGRLIIPSNFNRFFLGSAVDGELDKQGRVLISSALRAYAGLEKEVVLAGVLDKIEIWDKKAWDAHNEEVEADIDDIAGDMEDLGLRI